jgi:hypothetical protein
MRLCVLTLCSLLTAPAFAQNGFSADYDDARQVTLKGVVTKIDWINPHAYFYIDVRDSAGAVTNWGVEFGNPLDLEEEGWKPSALHIGDAVNVDGFPARGESRRIFAKSIVLTRTGAKLFTPVNRKRAAPSEPAPRWPDGQIRLGPAPGKKGYWGAASRGLAEDTGKPIAMNDEGLLKNLADADRVAPFQPWAKALYEYRQRRLLRDDPLLRCLRADPECSKRRTDFSSSSSVIQAGF